MEKQITYKIPSQNMAYLQERMDKLNKRAAKTKSAPVSMQTIGSITYQLRREDGTKYTQLYFEITVDGVAPKFDGWTFVGTLEHTDGGNILRAVPGKEIPEDYRLVRKVCSHCNKDRNRKDTYLVVNEANEWKQLGKSCLKDYTGHVSPQWLAQLASFLGELDNAQNDEAWGSGAKGPRKIGAVAFLEAACQAVINQGAYVTKAQASADLQSTSYLAWVQFFPLNEYDRKQRFDITEAGRKLADEVTQSILNIEHNPQANSFEKNVLITFLKGEIESRDAGILAASVLIHQRSLLKKFEEKKISTSEYQGEIKKRQEFTLTLTKVFCVDTEFGPLLIMRFLDDAGNVFVWKTGNGIGFQEASKYVVKATVIKHEAYKEVKQTRINRVVILKQVEEPIVDAQVATL